MAIMPMHKWGQIFRDRIHHHFKCKAPQHPTLETWTNYKNKPTFVNENTADDEIENSNGIDGPDGRLPHDFDTAVGWHRAIFILGFYEALRASFYVGTIQNLSFTPS